MTVDPPLPGSAPAERMAIYDSMCDVLSRLHRQDERGQHEQRPRGRPTQGSGPRLPPRPAISSPTWMGAGAA